MVNSALKLYKHPRMMGFDSLFKEFDTLMESDRVSYPPFNIEKISENEQHIVVALAGFDRTDVEVLIKDDILTIKDKSKDRSQEPKGYAPIYRGIAQRSFILEFKIGKDFKIVEEAVSMSNGLLTIVLKNFSPPEPEIRKLSIK